MNIDALTSQFNQSTGTASTTRALGQDTFLKLLVTQLQHQDPLKPKDDAEFLSQLAQFSSLEKMTEIRQSISELSDLIRQQMGLPAAGGESGGTTSTDGTAK